MLNNREIKFTNSNGLLSDDQLNSNTPHSHDNVGEIVKESSDIDNSKYNHTINPNPTSLTFNENPEDNQALVDYEEATYNEMNDQGVSNKMTHSDRSSIGNSSKIGTNNLLIIRLSMKKHNYRKLPFQKNMLLRFHLEIVLTRSPALIKINQVMMKIPGLQI